MNDIELIKSVRLDSLSKHPGKSSRYASRGIESCKQVLINRKHNSNIYQFVFEEYDGFGHGVNVPPEMIDNRDHIRDSTVACPRCGGAGKLTLGALDCTECDGTGRVPGEIVLT